MRSDTFKNLKWPEDDLKMSELNISDLSDAKRCAITAICYAKTIGLLDTNFPDLGAYPYVNLPCDADEKYSQELFNKE